MNKIIFYLVISLGTMLAIASPAGASGFDAGHIVDDGIFTNKSSMSVADIQTFLNSKVPQCDTNGTQPASDFGYPNLTHAQYAANKGWPGPPYICLKDYSENSLTSAQIIYNTSQQYQINPQVLIVLLQKEQGLVTDTWPLPVQYKSATGYGCPDTAPCDSQYYGLTNQINWSAKMFRAILNNSPAWYTPYILGNNYIQYNPDKNCGGSIVNIQNRSTQALYNYTPYQPNSKVLDWKFNGGPAVGSGYPDCGAFGNVNFYAYFTSWFGSPTKKPLPACTTTEVDCVYEFLNENTQKSFYTSDPIERNQVYQGNFSFIGIAFHTRKTTDANVTPVNRLYNSSRNFHLWTSDQGEINSLIASGNWTDEGVKFYMDPIDTNTGPTVHRLYTQFGTGRHILSSSAIEIQRLKTQGYIDEGVVFRTASLRFTPTIPAANKINTYRFYFEGKHFWTSDLNERETLIDQGLKYEGIAWESSNQGTIPVFRVYSSTGYHFWTTSSYERDQLLEKGWRNEGIAWSSLSTGQATYRLYNKSTGRHLFTTSSYEKDTLINSSSWRDEGVSWYQ